MEEVCPAEWSVSGATEGADSTLHNELRVACRDSLHIRHRRPGRPKHQLGSATTQPPPTFLTHLLSLSSSSFCLIFASTAAAKPQGLMSTYTKKYFKNEEKAKVSFFHSSLRAIKVSLRPDISRSG